MKKQLTLLSVLALSSILLFSWCKKKQEIPTIENRDKVTINYDSSLQDWEIIEQNQTITITVWQQDSFPILDTELLGLKVWDEKTFTTNNPNEWYWIFHNEIKVQDISPAVFNLIWTTPKAWEQVNLWSLNWIVLEVSPVTVKIDFNEKQTRENVEFHVTVLSIEKVSTEE